MQLPQSSSLPGLRSVGALAFVVVLASCDDSESTSPEVTILDGGDGGVDAAVPLDASTLFDVGDDAAAPEPESEAGADAAVALPATLGINVWPARGISQDAGGADPSEALLRDLDLIALRVGATRVALPWDLTAVEETRERIARFDNAGIEVSLELQLVSGSRPTHPAVDGDLQLDALLPLVDELFAEELPVGHVLLGNSLDARLAALVDDERQAFANLVTDLMTAIKQHSDRPRGLLVGYNARLSAHIAPIAGMEAWRDGADVLGVDWLAVSAAGQAIDPISVRQQLDDLVASNPENKPLLLQQVGFPSSPIVGGSPEGQAEFFEHLFDTVETLDNRLALVSISTLNDPASALCEQTAADLGEGGSDFASAWCSIGLRTNSLTLKPAYHSVLEGLARFGSR